jgi:hypothetical protein
MKRASPDRIFQAPFILALVMACLLAMQGVVSATPATLDLLSHRADASAATVSGAGEACSLHHKQDDQAPGEQRHGCLCVCCSLRSDDNAATFPAVIFEIADILAVAPFVTPVYDFDIPANFSQLGWTSSWSSRAPPSI